MPRPKRQRPAWLPRAVPFKEGRYFGLARQTLLAWSSAFLAVVFFSMTASFAMEKSRLSHVKFVYSSRSNTILVLRVLSEAASLFLATTVYSTFEVIQWVLISRPEGIGLPQFLALHPSTGPLGLIALALGRGLPPNQWPMKPRLMSLFRLAATSAIPVLGILVMSNVDTEAIYVPRKDTTKPMAFGMKPFNGSVASQLDVWADMMFNMGYVTFLNDPLHTIDVTPRSERKGCEKGAGLSPNDHCTRKLLITQEYQNVEASFPSSWKPNAEVVRSSNQQVYVLEYKDNINVTEIDLHCQDFNSGPASYRLCMRNAEDGALEASMKTCPAKLISSGQCAENTEWQSSKGFTTSLRTAFVDATVSYSRVDGRILSHEIQSDSRPTIVNAPELLSAMTSVLNATMTSPTSQASNPILGSISHLFGRVVAGHMYRISKLLDTNPAAIVKGTNALQSLMGITLFYCQNGVLGQTILLPFSSNSTAVKDYYKTGAFEVQNATAAVALANTRYRIDVGRATLIAYIVLGGVTLFIAITALVIGSILELIKHDAEPTLWPALDFYTQCRVEDHNGKVVAANKRIELAWIHDGRQLFKDVEGLRVTRRKRQLRTLEEPQGPIERNEND